MTLETEREIEPPEWGGDSLWGIVGSGGGSWVTHSRSHSGCSGIDCVGSRYRILSEKRTSCAVEHLTPPQYCKGFQISVDTLFFLRAVPFRSLWVYIYICGGMRERCAQTRAAAPYMSACTRVRSPNPRALRCCAGAPAVAFRFARCGMDARGALILNNICMVEREGERGVCV